MNWSAPIGNGRRGEAPFSIGRLLVEYKWWLDELQAVSDFQ